VREIMVSPVYYVTPDQTVEDCMVLMTQHRFRHLPVQENHQRIGIISTGGVVTRFRGGRRRVGGARRALEVLK